MKLKSVATKDKWARGGFGGGKQSVSSLFIPIHTILPATAVVASPGVLVFGAVDGVANRNAESLLLAPPAAATLFTAGMVALPVGISIDLYNMVIGAPSTAIKNPWREYEYNGILRNMEPVENNASQYPPIQK